MIQLLFQLMSGSQALDSVFEEMLNRVCMRMEDNDHMPIHLKKHILGIFMSAMNYNSQMTLTYLENKQLTSGLIMELVNIKKSFTHEYEKKLFIIGLSRMLQCQQLPESLRPLLVQILNELIEMLSNLHEQVSKRIAAAAAKEVKPDDNDSDEDSDESDYDDEEDEEEEDTNQNAKQKDVPAAEN